jgi:uncharacterized protein (TIGR03083 family)
MDDSDLQPAVARNYLTLAGVLAGVPDADWETPSLCERWRVREVVAHLTMPARYSEDDFMAELKRFEFDFSRFSNEVASRDAGLSTDRLVSDLGSEVMGLWTPPGGGYHGALNHIVIHGLDVTVPLGPEPCATPEDLRVVLDDLTHGGGHAHFGVEIAGRQLEASDLGWSYGSGAPLRAPAGDLALSICGRAIPKERLAGHPLRRLDSPTPS